MTGQAQTANYSATQFKNAVCANLTVMFNCAKNLYIDVRNYPTRRRHRAQPDQHERHPEHHQLRLCARKSGDIVVVRLIYQWPIIAAKSASARPRHAAS
jgi:hypothetical protein